MKLNKQINFNWKILNLNSREDYLVHKMKFPKINYMKQQFNEIFYF